MNLATSAKQFLAIFALVVSLWLFTNVPLFISGILGVSLAIIMGIVTPAQGFAPFADPIIFLFLGGFLLAKALENTELDKRLAYKALGNPWVQSSPKRVVFAFLFLCFILSMWISNTAAVAMLLPLSYGVLQKLKEDFNIENNAFSEQFLLALAYSATVGGNVTPIGSPPNIIAIGHLKNLADIHLGFLQWMAMALPISLIVFLFIYKRCVSHLPERPILKEQTRLDDYRSLSVEQKYVIAVFSLTVFFWIMPNLLGLFLIEGSALFVFLKHNLSAATVGIFFASLLFLFPLKSPEKILNSTHASQVDWPSLLLFGSGLSLGKILFQTGLAKFFADSIASFSGELGTTAVIILLIFITILFTELASNTASANIIIPIMIAFCKETNISILVVAFAFALSCNSAYMLPVATPPNAIVYGTKKVNKMSMVKSGIKINILCSLLIGLFFLIFKST